MGKAPQSLTIRNCDEHAVAREARRAHVMMLWALLVLTVEAMTKNPLVQLMELKARQLSVTKWPLAHREIEGMPGCSWGEVLGCSDDDFKTALHKIGKMASSRRRSGVFQTAMNFKSRGKVVQFSTVVDPLRDGTAPPGS